jgi:hypothetical protein
MNTDLSSKAFAHFRQFTWGTLTVCLPLKALHDTVSVQLDSAAADDTTHMPHVCGAARPLWLKGYPLVVESA